MAFHAYGLTVSSAFALPGPNSAGSPASPCLALQLGDGRAVERRWSGAADAPVWRALSRGAGHARLERGVSGDWRFAYDQRATFHLCAAGCTLLCAPEDPDDLYWTRFLLDTALHCASLAFGFEALHASAVSTPSGTLAFVGSSGSGKTTLAAELVARGYPLFCDDVLALSRHGGRVLGHPGPPLMNLAHDGPVAPEEIGYVLAEFPGEAWVEVPCHDREPQPLAAICLLERREGLPTAMSPVSGSAVRLLPHSLGFGRSRAAACLSLLRALAARVPLYRLQADPAASPAELASAIERSLAPTPELVAAG